MVLRFIQALTLLHPHIELTQEVILLFNERLNLSRESCVLGLLAGFDSHVGLEHRERLVPRRQPLCFRLGGIGKLKRQSIFMLFQFSCCFYFHVFIFIKFLSGPALLNLLHQQRALRIFNGGQSFLFIWEAQAFHEPASCLYLFQTLKGSITLNLFILCLSP